MRHAPATIMTKMGSCMEACPYPAKPLIERKATTAPSISNAETTFLGIARQAPMASAAKALLSVINLSRLSLTAFSL